MELEKTAGDTDSGGKNQEFIALDMLKLRCT